MLDCPGYLYSSRPPHNSHWRGRLPWRARTAPPPHTLDVKGSSWDARDWAQGRHCSRSSVLLRTPLASILPVGRPQLTLRGVSSLSREFPALYPVTHGILDLEQELPGKWRGGGGGGIPWNWSCPAVLYLLCCHSATSGQRRPCHGEPKDPEDMWVKLKRRLFAEAQVSKDQGSMIWRGRDALCLFTPVPLIPTRT